MRIAYPSIILFLLLVSVLQPQAQTFKTNSDSIYTTFNRLIQTNTKDDIVLTTNRNVYLTGENIWFTAYLVNAGNGKIDRSINNLFADLVNEKDSTIVQLVLNNADLHTTGAFTIPESLPTGFYWIRYYIAKQLAQNNNAVFLHAVYILNKNLKDESAYAKQLERSFRSDHSLNPAIHFYAERLTAIAGIISAGIIEIKDNWNKPLQATGELINNKDSVISHFTTNSFGLARLTFVNKTTEKYTAVFHVNNQTVRYELPAVNDSAIQLSVLNQTAASIKAFVTLEEKVPADAHTTIMAVQHDSLYYVAAGTGNYGITIPISNFTGGIAQLLLFNENKQLVDQREIYIPKERIQLEIKPDKTQYAARENVNVHIKVMSPDRKPLASLLSVAVEDEWIAQLSDSMEAIELPPIEMLLLDNWLGNNNANYTADEIDLLLATKKITTLLPSTKGWNSVEDYDSNQQLQHLTGSVTNKKGNGIENRIVTAIATNIHDFFMDVDTTNKEGKFSLQIPQGFDSLQLSLQISDKHQVQTGTDSLHIESFRFPHLLTPAVLKEQFIADNFRSLALIQQYHIDTAFTFQGKAWLAPVTVKTFKKEEPGYDASRRINSISQIVTRDKFRYGGLDAIGNAVLMVAGVSLSYGDISIFGPSFNLQGEIIRPLVIMDGYEIPTSNVLGFLNSLDPASIDFVEVLRGPEAAIYGARGGSGVISVNTKHTFETPDYIKTNIRFVKPVTYHVCPKFQMPDYSNKNIRNGISPDPRTTIYWSSNIATDTAGETDIHFFTGDNVTNYAITVTGLTADGRLFHKKIVISNIGKK